MRLLGLLLAGGLAACSHNGTVMSRDEAVLLAHFHRVGVPAFKDSRGEGAAIAQAVSARLVKLAHDPADARRLDELVLRYQPDKDNGLGAEAMTMIRDQTSADAVLFGRMAEDWSAAVVSLVETEMGGQVISGVVKPKGRPAFSSVDDVAEEVVRALDR